MKLLGYIEPVMPLTTAKEMHIELKCEFCNRKKKTKGFDTDEWRNKVLKTIVCKSCGKSTIDGVKS